MRSHPLAELIRRSVAGLALLAALPAVAGAYSVLVSTRIVQPGDTLRIELNDILPQTPMKVKFDNRTYSFYAVGPNAQRALIGIALPTEPGAYALRIEPRHSATPATDQATELAITVAPKRFKTENISLSRHKTDLQRAEKRESTKIGQVARFISKEQQWESVFIDPVTGPIVGEYGIKRLRNGKPAGFHKGVDLKARQGTPLRASNRGTVVLAAAYRAHGNVVMLDHGQGVMTIYLHLEKIGVKYGDKVGKADPIGTVGSTGISTAPHVHWQIFVNAIAVDPESWKTNEF